MKKIAVFTSGGDSPGMNPAIRSVVRAAVHKDLKVYGIRGGYQGMIDGHFHEMNSHSVSNIIQRGGTILHTSRCSSFHSEDGILMGKKSLEEFEIDGLVGIGGNGTFKGLIDLSQIWDGKVVGVPGTIDNDLYGTDDTIGFDTAVNTALQSIDKIRDTAESHERVFLIEVMGRDSGFIALYVAIAGGAEEVAVPEQITDIHTLCHRISEERKSGRTSSIIVVAEGNREGNVFDIADHLQKISGEKSRVVVLGHVLRGGSPTSQDRLLGSKLGAYAVLTLLEGVSGVMVGESRSELTRTPLQKAVEEKKQFNDYLLTLQHILSHT